MPLFTKKFDPKCAPLRTGRINDPSCPQILEDIDDYQNIHFNINDKEFKFADGIWVQMHQSKNGGNQQDDVIKMKRILTQLEQENNLLQVKIDILLDLLTESLSEMNTINKN